MDIYAENVLDHYRHPRNKGKPPQVTVSHEEKNESCGDEVTIHLQIENDVIRSVRWEGTGCAISQAAMSLLSEKLEGMSKENTEALRQSDVFKLLGVPIGPRRYQCALIGLLALKNALHTLKSEPVQHWADTIEITGDQIGDVP